MTQNRIVLVTGATGSQGGAVVRELLARKHRVRALTRDDKSPAAVALARRGVELYRGRLEDRASLEGALDGVDAVFGMGTPFETGTDAETRQGTTLVDAAKAAGAFLVYSSVGSANQNTGIPHFESKARVERHLEDVDARATVLAPVYFMENLLSFGLSSLREGVVAMPLPADRLLAQVAVQDIAACAVSAIEDPESYAGKRYDLAGDELSGQTMANVLSGLTGRRFGYRELPMEGVRAAMGDDGVAMYEWFDRVGFRHDPAALSKAFPHVHWHSFESWAKGVDWDAVLDQRASRDQAARP